MHRPWLLTLTLLLTGPAWLAAQPIRTLTGHDAAVYAIAFSPDGRALASAGFDRVVSLWNVGSGQRLRVVARHRAKVVSVAFDVKGNTLASADSQGTIVLSSLHGKRLRRWAAHLGCCNDIHFLHDGQLASCGTDGLVRIWTRAGRKVAELDLYHAGPQFGLALSPAGQTLAVGGLDGIVRLYDVAGQYWLGELNGTPGTVYCLAFSPCGRFLIAGSDDAARVWDVESGKVLFTLTGHEDPVYQVSFSPDGRRILTAGKSGLVILWDAQSGKALHGERFKGQAITATLGPDGNSLAAGTIEGVCYIEALPRHLR